MSLPNEIMPLGLLGAGAEEQYQIERSLRFNLADSAYLSRTPASAGNRKTWTWAGWVKRSALGARQALFTVYTSPYLGLEFSGTDTITVHDSTAPTTLISRQTTAVYRDTSAWYHVVLAYDTTQATAANRVKLYVNGVEVTVFQTNSNPAQNTDTAVNMAYLHAIGVWHTVGYYQNGYLADIHFIDGQALDPSSFTKFDDNGVLQPKAYTGSYGTNGFHLPFSDNSTDAALGTDTSGNGNTWTVNNLSVNQYNAYALVASSAAASVSIANNASFQLNQGDFTVEYFVNFLNTSSYKTLLGLGYSSAGRYIFQTFSGTTQIIAYLDTGVNLVTLNTTTTLNVGTWYHIALQRSGSNYYLYVDGILQQTAAVGTSNLNESSNDLLIGTGGAGYFANAEISNVRIVKGTAVYSTSGFSKPTSALTAVPGTSLLTLQSGTLVDNSVYNHTLVNSGSAAMSVKPLFGALDPDSLVDTPTNYGEDTGAGGEIRGNYATFNPIGTVKPITGIIPTLTNGNLDAAHSGGSWQYANSTIAVPAGSGKYYCEFYISSSYAPDYIAIGVNPATASNFNATVHSGSQSGIFYSNNGEKWVTGSNSAYGSAYTTGDLIGVALNCDSGQVTFYKNNTSQGTISFSSNLTNGGTIYFTIDIHTSNLVANFGQRPFDYTAPSGFKALCTTNLPTPDPAITPGSKVMDVALYTGNGGTQTISGLGFSPDFVWIKNRSHGRDNNVYDAVRGATKLLSTNSTSFDVYDGTGSEQTVSGLTAFNSDGFSVGSDNVANQNTYTYVAWCWDAGSSTVTNTQGSITSQVRANASAGFSVVTYTGNATAGATIGHGLGVAPGMIIIKNRDDGGTYWVTYHSSLGGTKALALNLTNSVLTNSLPFSNTDPTSTVFSVGGGGSFSYSNNQSGENHVAYCFAPVAGYSSFGRYIGNGSADGPFVYTGFRPRWILFKNTGQASDWAIYDSARSQYNVTNDYLTPNTSGAEGVDYTNGNFDILSNGFKIRTTWIGENGGGNTLVYAAFAEHPFSISRAR